MASAKIYERPDGPTLLAAQLGGKICTGEMPGPPAEPELHSYECEFNTVCVKLVTIASEPRSYGNDHAINSSG